MAMAQTIRKRTRSAMAALALVVAAIGCEEGPAAPPVTLTQYENQVHKRDSYPDVVVVQHNLRRILDRSLPIEQRRASLELVAKLKDRAPEAVPTLVSLLGDTETDPQLQRDLMRFLLRSDDPSMTPFVVTALQRPQLRGSMSDALLGWLARNAEGGALAELVKLWAQEPVDGPHEASYREIVLRMERRPWDDALLAGLNARRFLARGSALEVLALRIRPSELKRRIMALPTGSDAVAGMQTFINGFDYMPISRASLVQTVVAYKAKPLPMRQASELAATWAADRRRPYFFNIRDYSLLAALSSDREAARLTRSAVLLELARAQLKRRHPIYRAGGPQAARTNTRLAGQAEHLSMADLWNIKLVDAMLARPDIQEALAELARRDREDTATAMGGLLVYQRGRAEAQVYPADSEQRSDVAYVAGSRLRKASRDALGRFVAHFETLNNAERTGPTLEELADAKMANYYGLVLTSLDADTFCAHYYTPGGVVVSLGKFPFGR